MINIVRLLKGIGILILMRLHKQENMFEVDMIEHAKMVNMVKNIFNEYPKWFKRDIV